jgi:hypothetical protein
MSLEIRCEFSITRSETRGPVVFVRAKQARSNESCIVPVRVCNPHSLIIVSINSSKLVVSSGSMGRKSHQRAFGRSSAPESSVRTFLRSGSDENASSTLLITHLKAAAADTSACASTCTNGELRGRGSVSCTNAGVKRRINIHTYCLHGAVFR